MDSPLPDLHDLRAFCAVVDHGSITAAAKMLRETKGSVSRRLVRLERTLGVALVRRSPRLVQPTEEGIAYRNRAARVLEALDDARREIEHAGNAPRGTLRITAPPDLAVDLLAPMVARFLEQYPEVRVEMLVTERVLDFDAHQLDVALRPGVSLADSSLIAHKLSEMRWVFAAAPSYLAAHPAPAEFGDLAAHRLLLFGPQERMLAEIAHRGRKREVEWAPPALHSTDGNVVHRAALAGGGVALLPSPVVNDDLRTGRLVALLPGFTGFPKISLYLLHPPSRFVAPKVKAFQAFLTAALKDCASQAKP